MREILSYLSRTRFHNVHPSPYLNSSEPNALHSMILATPFPAVHVFPRFPCLCVASHTSDKSEESSVVLPLGFERWLCRLQIVQPEARLCCHQSQSDQRRNISFWQWVPLISSGDTLLGEKRFFSKEFDLQRKHSINWQDLSVLFAASLAYFLACQSFFRCISERATFKAKLVRISRLRNYKEIKDHIKNARETRIQKLRRSICI